LPPPLRLLLRLLPPPLLRLFRTTYEYFERGRSSCLQFLIRRHFIGVALCHLNGMT
jgi:hypothetical protein